VGSGTYVWPEDATAFKTYEPPMSDAFMWGDHTRSVELVNTKYFRLILKRKHPTIRYTILSEKQAVFLSEKDPKVSYKMDAVLLDVVIA
jgi:hypothetical protein